ncbi:hypothetical protein FRC12_011814 [Ceratobasidium sp. 428]|nr:hypothetical protein FRC12_011814 [Ceratobasidium sp. 428]
MPEDSPKARLWLDGCFDGFHFAHANAVRQSRQFGDYVIVGVHSDRVIEKNKGPTLFDERERYDLIRGCRWVDEVAEDVPYVTDMDYIAKYDIDYVCHGDDPVLVSDLGSDTGTKPNSDHGFRTPKATIVMKMRRRQENTKNILGRMASQRRPSSIASFYLPREFRPQKRRFGNLSMNLRHPVLSRHQSSISQIQITGTTLFHAIMAKMWCTLVDHGTCLVLPMSSYFVVHQRSARTRT